MEAVCCTYHQLTYSSPNRSTTTTKRATQRSLPFRKWRFREKVVRRMGQKQKKDKTERAKGLRRRTREAEEIPKSGIKLTALRFQTGGRHQKSPTSLQGGQDVQITLCDPFSGREP